jgi:phosphatidylglycerol lysyltransferase
MPLDSLRNNRGGTMPAAIRRLTRARGPAAGLWAILRALLPLLLGLGCLWLLAVRLDGFDIAALRAALSLIDPAQWAGAALATAASFWAVGRYDAVVHRHLGTGLPPARTARAGMLSIAIAQTLGFGVITGALARWRALPAASLALCTQLSALVAVFFLGGWAVLTALVCLLAAPVGLWGGWMVLPLLGGLSLTVAALLNPRLRLWPGRTLTLPSLPTMAAVLGLTLLDTAAAALALLFLLPGDLGLGMVQLYPVFLLALGAGLVSGTPGGVGPFELTLFALLPDHPEPSLMAGILGFRLIYYALPAALAALLLMRAPACHARPRNRRLPAPGPRLLAHAHRAELGIARQNGGRMLACDTATGIVVETGQTLTLLFDPAAGPLAPLLPVLRGAARNRNRVAVLYKCSARSAVMARRARFRLFHVADEAVLDPTRFRLDTPRRRQLRRKLRQAGKSGLTVTRAAHLPLACMARVDAEWRARQGQARGFSMGRFCGDYLSHHQVFLAWKDDELLGFASFHTSAHEVCLDLMRSAAGAPDGTMHALIHAAIAHAAAHGRSRLTLASVPADPARAGRAERALRRALLSASGGPGLTQFKAAFAPRFEPLYIAAPSLPGLALAAADLALAVWRAPAPHDDVDRFEIAPARQM